MRRVVNILVMLKLMCVALLCASCEPDEYCAIVSKAVHDGEKEDIDMNNAFGSAAGKAVEVRGRWPRASGLPTNTVTVRPSVNALPPLQDLNGGVELISYSSENVDVPEHITVNLTSDPDIAVFPGFFQIAAKVRYGYGKSMTTAFIDLRRGARFTIEASSVDISVLYYSPSGTGPRSSISASLAYGSASYGALTMPTFTTLVGGEPGVGPLVAPGAVSPESRIPPRASSVSVFPDTGPALYQVIQSFGVAAPYIDHTFAFAPPSVTPMQLGGMTDILSIRNTDAVAHYYVLVYQLSL